MTDDFSQAEFDEVRKKAVALPCPRCRAIKGAACMTSHGTLLRNLGDERPGIHTERLNAVRGLPTREKRTRHPFRD
jgi:hypothetical protein